MTGIFLIGKRINEGSHLCGAARPRLSKPLLPQQQKLESYTPALEPTTPPSQEAEADLISKISPAIKVQAAALAAT